MLWRIVNIIKQVSSDKDSIAVKMDKRAVKNGLKHFNPQNDR